jgi:hypothetical protein
MALTSLQTIYDNLGLLEQGDVVKSALYRQLAQEVIGDPQVSLSWRQAIADRLQQANHLLAMLTVGKDDSY